MTQTETQRRLLVAIAARALQREARRLELEEQRELASCRCAFDAGAQRACAVAVVQYRRLRRRVRDLALADDLAQIGRALAALRRQLSRWPPPAEAHCRINNACTALAGLLPLPAGGDGDGPAGPAAGSEEAEEASLREATERVLAALHGPPERLPDDEPLPAALLP